MQLFVWNQHSTQPVLKYCEHTAAVKAIAWSPHLHGLLASGGGTADRCIRFWNTTTNSHLSCMDTGSQVNVLVFNLFILLCQIHYIPIISLIWGWLFVGTTNFFTGCCNMCSIWWRVILITRVDYDRTTNCLNQNLLNAIIVINVER